MNNLPLPLKACLLIAILLAAPPVWTQEADNAVVLLYHHVSSSTPASTSVTPEVFEQHLQYLAQRHNVISLEQAVDALQHKKLLPERAVVITFDDGYRNIHDNAHPILAKYGMPYTVFITPQLIGKQKNQLTWQQISEMEKKGARFANHTSFHRHLLERRTGQSQSEWLAGIEQDIDQSEAVLKKKLGYSTGYLAYPYGEFNRDIQGLITRLGMVGFGQHSGAIYSGSDFSALPRFPAAGIYANLDTLKVKIDSLALPLVHTTDVQAPGDFSFAFAGSDVQDGQLKCYFSNRVLPLSVDQQAVKVTLTQQVPTGRSRVNCTAPSIAQPSRYYWFSQPWFVPREDGTYPD